MNPKNQILADLAAEVAIACWENNSGEFISANSVVPPSNIGSATHESTLYLRLGTRR
jgi:hypothetical protein